MSDHTPGPWYIRDLHPGRATFNIGTDPNDPYSGEIAVVFRCGGRFKTEADARLIAAAPELLEVLRKVRDQIDDPHMGSVDHRSDVALVSAIRIAVAKAEGRS